MRFKIDDVIIEKCGVPFIVAEVGINHNGELEKALEMIEVAKSCGVDAIKFQTFKAKEFVNDEKLTYTYKSQGKMVTESQLEMFQRYEFSSDEWAIIKKKCEDEKILFLSTPQNESDLQLLQKIGIPAIKVGSDDLTNLPLLKKYSKTGLPMILSSGMANLKEIDDALREIGALDDYPTILLVTTSEYPTSPENVNLLKFKTLTEKYPKLILGFSDHTQGTLASSLACAFGAVFFEKHFTLSHELPGPDHWFSEDPKGLKNWVNSIKISYSMLGTKEVRATKNEEEMKVLARRSIVTLFDIEKGDSLDEHNLGLRRPGNGLPPSMFNQICGKKSTKKIPKGKIIELEDFI